jgi:mRNA interferase MazF
MMGYQWNIFWVDLDPVKGSEQTGKRPVLVISEEAVNLALPIVTVICLTTLKPGRKIYPIEALLNPDECGLPQPSIAMAHQIRALAKERLTEICGSINKEETREKIRNAVKLYLDLN